MAVCSLPMRSRERSARDVFDTFAVHSGFLYDVTDIHCFQMWIFSKQDKISSEILLFKFIFIWFKVLLRLDFSLCRISLLEDVGLPCETDRHWILDVTHICGA